MYKKAFLFLISLLALLHTAKMPNCTECHLTFTTVDYLYFHYKEAHNFQDLKVFRCKESNCFRDWSSWKSFKNHLVNYHEFNENSPVKSNKKLDTAASTFTFDNSDSITSSVKTYQVSVHCQSISGALDTKFVSNVDLYKIP